MSEQRVLNYRNDREPLRRWFLKRLVVFFVALFVVGNARNLWQAAQSVARYVDVSRAQSRCARFELPPSTVAFELDPTLAAAVIAANADGVSMPYESNIAQPAAGRTTPCWNDLVKKIGRGPNDPPGASLFCHALHDARKRQYIIHIDMEIIYQGQDPIVEFRPACLAVQGMFDGPICGTGRFRISSNELTAAIRSRNLRVFWGTVDPNDPTHVTIQLSISGVARHIDGFMRNQTFQMKPGDAAATSSEQWSSQQTPW